MQRDSARPLPRLLGVTLILAMLVALAHAGPASADPLGDKQRFDAAVADAVNQIRITRDAIVTERLELLVARDKARTQKRVIEGKRAAIQKMLRRRRSLMHVLGDQVRIAEAATSIGQTKL